MNPAFFGDSYDLVKRFFCGELSALGYSVVVDPMLTGVWGGAEREFYRLIGVAPDASPGRSSNRTALFLDPDTGVRENAGSKHASFQRLADEASNHALVFAFDQSFSHHLDSMVVMKDKLAQIRALGCHAMYYNSHARFLFRGQQKDSLNELRDHLVSLGMPTTRLLECDG
ncbi:MAG TPA: hypothetical protein VGH74_22090 [Planctomycetaceae bacterium]|jgi:hypothetical protein